MHIFPEYSVLLTSAIFGTFYFFSPAKLNYCIKISVIMKRKFFRDVPEGRQISITENIFLFQWPYGVGCRASHFLSYFFKY